MNTLLEQFLLEARELVQDAADDLVALEHAPDDPERLERVFRAVHTLKGGAAIANFPVMAQLLHAGEDVLSALRKRDIPSAPAVIKAALRCVDQVGKWLDEIEVSNELPADASVQAEILTQALRQHLPQSATKMSAQAGPDFDWVGPLVAATPGVSDKLGRSEARLVAIAYEPRAKCFFSGDDPLGLLRKVPQLLALKIEPRSPWPPLEDMNPFECKLVFRAVSRAPREQIAEIFRLVADQVRIADFAPDAIPAAERGGAASRDLIWHVLQAQRDMLALPCRDKEFVGRLGAAARTAINVLRFAKAGPEADRIERARDEAVAARAAAPVLDALDRLLAEHASGSSKSAAAEQAAPSAAGGSLASRTFRIDETRVDHLVNVAGELIVARNGLNDLAARIVAELGEGEIARALKTQNAAIDRLVNEAHRAVVRLRMVPLAQVFRRFPRIVRDAAQELGKSVACATKGEDIEADKSIVDALFEPLLHVVRNAVGHGIEPPDERRAKGKAEEGQLSLTALRYGEQLIIEVADDGRGIDPQAVRRKAREQSLITEDELKDLSDEQVIQLVFLSGFSTAPEISQMSGRGVGLAAVRSAAERIGGVVSVSSDVGRGTTVRLALPLSMALVRIMTVESGGQIFGVPIDAIAETVRLPRDRLIRIKSGQAFVLRDQIVPTCQLHRLLDLPDGSRSDANDALILVTDAGGETAGVEVDGIGERLDIVMKPMQGLLAEVPDYAGTTLLGNGRVLLVLNLSAILQ